MQKSFYKKILTSTISGIIFLGVSIFFTGGVLQASAQQTPVMLQDVNPLPGATPSAETTTETNTPLMLQGATPAVTNPDGLQYDPITRQYTQTNSVLSDESPLSSVLDEQYAPPSNPGEESEAQAEGAGSLLAGLSCGGLDFDFSGCAPIIVYNVIFRPASFVLSLSASLFDYSLALSIDRTLVDQEFVNNAWTIMRDFANMAFIFILLYAGITTILGGDDWRRTVIQVVIVALFINFSLLFTKVIIDTGNIFAVGIYNALGPDPQNSGGGGVQKRELSGSLVEALQPQNFTDTAAKGTAFDALVVFIIAAAVNLAVAWAFFKVALVFLGRLIGFWVLMIVSPIAFISTATPKGEIFHSWLHKLIDITFVAPVFLFFMYLILLVLQSDFITSISDSMGGATGFLSSKLLLPSMVAIVLVYMISKAVSIAEHMAGEFGNLGSQVGGKLMGVAGGVALGGAGLLGRNVVGGLANQAFKSGTMQRWANTEAGENAGRMARAKASMVRGLGRQGTFALDTTRNASFDARNVGFIASGIKQTGVDVGKAGGKGGFVKEEKHRFEEMEKEAKLFEMTDGQKEKFKDEAKRSAETNASFAKNRKEEASVTATTAEKSLKDAAEAHENSTTAQALKAAQDELEAIKTDPRRSGIERTVAEKKLADAQTAHATSGTAQAVNTAKNFLEEAKKKEKAALEELEKANKELTNIEKDSEKKIGELNKKRRATYAEHAVSADLAISANFTGYSSNDMKKLKAKIAKGHKDKDPYKEMLEKAKKELKEKEEAEKKGGSEEGGSASTSSGGGDTH